MSEISVVAGILEPTPMTTFTRNCYHCGRKVYFSDETIFKVKNLRFCCLECTARFYSKGKIAITERVKEIFGKENEKDLIEMGKEMIKDEKEKQIADDIGTFPNN